MRVPTRFSVFVILAAASLSCADPVGPGTASVSGLDLSLTIQPRTVRAGGSVRAILSIRNTRPDTAAFVSGCSTLAAIGVFRGGERLDFEGTGSGCYMVLTTFKIPPGEVLGRVWTATAEEVNGLPDRGDYVLRVQFHATGLRDLELPFRVE